MRVEAPVSSTFGSCTTRFQRLRHIGVAGLLAAGKRTGIAAQIGQMLGNCLRCRQNSLPNRCKSWLTRRWPPKIRSTLAHSTPAFAKSSRSAEPYGRAWVCMNTDEGTRTRASRPGHEDLGPKNERAQAHGATETDGNRGDQSQQEGQRQAREAQPRSAGAARPATARHVRRRRQSGRAGPVQRSAQPHQRRRNKDGQ